MKLRKFMVASTAFIMILGLLVVVPVHAQVTFDSWVGLWMKGSVQDKGVIVDDLGTVKAVDKAVVYGYVASYAEGPPKILSALLIEQDTDGTWLPAVPFVVQIISGTPLDYVSYALIPPGFVPGYELLAVVVQATGKESKGVLKAKIKTVGGCVVYDSGGGSYFAANESLKMKSVPEDKVPDEVKALIP